MSGATKVLHILPSFSHLGGVERHVLDLIAHFPHHLAASSGGLYKPKNHIALPLDSKNPWRILQNRKLIQRLVQSHKIDLIHVHSRAPAWSLVGISIPWISTFHGIYGCQNKLKKFYNAGMLKGESVIAISDFVAHHIQNIYNPSIPIHVIKEGIDTEYFAPMQVTAQKLWGIDKKVILLVGRFTRLKGHKILIEATRGLNATIILMGDQSQKESYVRALKSMAHPDVVFMSSMEDPRPAYAAAHIVVSCSIEPETFGRTTAEALSMGKFFVGTHLGATPELCQNAGWLTPAGDIKALRAILEQLLSMPYTVHTEARQQAEKCLSIAVMLNKLNALYNAVHAEYTQKIFKS